MRTWTPGRVPAERAAADLDPCVRGARSRAESGAARAIAIVISLLVAGARIGAAQDAWPMGFAQEARQLADLRAVRPAPFDSEKARSALTQLYASDSVRPLWSVDGRPSAQALAAIRAMSDAAAKGLHAEDYDVDVVRAASAALQSEPRSPQAAARFDVSLSSALLRFLSHLHMGRTSPRTLRFDLPDAHARLDLAAVVVDVSRSTDVAASIAQAEPPYAGYVALIDALVRYRTLAADTTLRTPRLPSASLRPGDPYADGRALRRLLSAAGDLALEDTVAVRDTLGAEIYGGSLVTAIISFQRRHGLEADGIIGGATAAQLRVPMAARMRQIELTLERWRWLPDRPPDRYAVINVPAFRLSVFEYDGMAGQPVLSMAVIVGQANGRHHTPVFRGVMREVVIRPYWNVPPSIARAELLPIIRRRADYLERNSMEIVAGGDADATVYPVTRANLDRVAAGTLRLRQRPGPGNALGLLKFVFPNRYNVFMHGTPEQQLFAQTRRDFSHGCIRVETPTDLAEHALRGIPEWDRPAIERAMQGARTIHVSLDRPIDVYVLYATAVVREGVMHFYDDLYGHDRSLARTLGLMQIRRP